MVIRIIGIILSGIVFCNDGIHCQVQKQTAVLSNDISQHFIQVILRYNLTQYKIGTSSETPTPVSTAFCFRQFLSREKFQKVGVRYISMFNQINIYTLLDFQVKNQIPIKFVFPLLYSKIHSYAPVSFPYNDCYL